MTATQTTAKSIAQMLTLDFDQEMESTRKLLALVPLDDDHRGYRPHEKSMRLDNLATHIAEIPGWPKVILETDVLEIPADYKPTVAASRDQLLEIFDRSVREGRAAIDAARDEDIAKMWTFRFGSQTIFTVPRSHILRGSLNHLVHHRAQLGVYLRLNNIPIPGMYGPSADEK